MPYIVRRGNQVKFVVELFDANGRTPVPPSVNLGIAFTDMNGNPAGSATLAMVLHGFVWVVVWDSSGAPDGLATLSINPPTGAIAPPDPIMRICEGI